MQLKFRKKPLVVEAFQMTKERRKDNSEWPNWLHRAWNGNLGEIGTLQIARLGGICNRLDELDIVTLEGLVHVSWGDWIIQGSKGELYPCKPDIFSETYDAVESLP